MIYVLTLLLLYLFFYLTGKFFDFEYYKTYKKIRLTQYDSMAHAMENSPDFYKILYIYFSNPLFLIIHFLILYLVLSIKFTQFLLGVLYTIPGFIEILVNHIRKKETVFVVHIKRNPSLVDLLLVLFYYLPRAHVFKIQYLIIKKLCLKKKTSFDLKKYLSGVIFSIVVGYPFWMISFLETLQKEIIAAVTIPLEGKKNVFWIRCHLMLVFVYEALFKVRNSTLYYAVERRIYYVDSVIHFNPNSNKAVRAQKFVTGVLRSSRSVTERGREVSHPSLQTDRDTENCQNDIIITHSPLKIGGVAYFNTGMKDSKGDSQAEYNIVQEDATMRDTRKIPSFRPDMNTLYKIETMAACLRSFGHTGAVRQTRTMSAEIIYGEDGEIIEPAGNFYEESNKLIVDEERKSANSEKMYEINKLPYNTWETTLQQTCNVLNRGLELTRSVNLGDSPTLANYQKNMESMSNTSDIMQEYALSDDQQNNYIADIENEAQAIIDGSNDPDPATPATPNISPQNFFNS